MPLTSPELSQTAIGFRPYGFMEYTAPVWLPAHYAYLNVHMDTIEPAEQSALNAAIADCDAADACVLSSPAAARQMAAHLPSKSNASQFKVCVMGQGTADEARAMQPDLNIVLSTTGESMGLFQTLRHCRHVVFLRAQSGREDLMEALLAIGIRVSIHAVYTREPRADFSAMFQSAAQSFMRKNLRPKLVLSSYDQPLRILSALAAYPELSQWVQILSVLATHARVAARASALGFVAVQQNNL